MRVKLLLLSSVLFFIQCSNEAKKEDAPKKKKEKKDIDSTNENPNDFQIRALSSEFNSIPFLNSYDEQLFGNIEFNSDADSKFSAKITYSDIVTELNCDFTKLIPCISVLAYNNNYHQQLSVYLFEKQWHSARVEARNVHSSISYYEVVNPPKGKNWFLNAIKTENGKPIIVASYQFRLPESIIKKEFEKLNNRKYNEFAPYFFDAPVPQKIEYNSLRKLGRFYEGFAATLNHIDFDYEKKYPESILVRKLSPKKISYFIEQDFDSPELTKEGYDTLHFTKNSLKELYSTNVFSYKTTYSLNGSKDSLLEMQIDFKTKENTNTVRFVMGGIVFSEVPRLKTEEMQNGLYLPLGFSKYKNKEIEQEAYVLMGNTSGFWMDNTYGRNIDGIIIHWDKNSTMKMHIWLMGGDGMIPVSHYVTSLERVTRK